MIDVVKGIGPTVSNFDAEPSGCNSGFCKTSPEDPAVDGHHLCNASERHIDRDESCEYSTAVCRRSNTAGFLCVTSCATGKHTSVRLVSPFPDARRCCADATTALGSGCRLHSSTISIVLL